MAHKPLQFVVLHHENIPQPHFDLLIEITPLDPLLTFRCDHWPPVADPIRQPDHRRVYLTYEGAVSNGRGTVRRVAQGTYSILQNEPTVLKIQCIPGPVLELKL